MEFTDKVDTMYGRLEVWKKYPDGRMEKFFDEKNAITYRAKAIMSRILAGGLTPNAGAGYQWGTSGQDLRVSGIALGNGGHLLYKDDGTGETTNLNKTGVIVNAGTGAGFVTNDNTLPALPNIGSLDWGYASQPSRTVPGTSYEPVENGNVPWDGTPNITDNNVGVQEPGTTLYSETLRIPLDDVYVSNDGYSFPTKTEVTFKATLDQSLLNATDAWGFAQQPANWISEAGLIVGYRPDEADILTGQVYSNDGSEPSAGNFPTWSTKDGVGETNDPSGNASGLDVNKTQPSTVTAGVDTWSEANTWNLLSRKTFNAVPKSTEFSLVFAWTIGF
jgi:hypothetical protein